MFMLHDLTHLCIQRFDYSHLIFNSNNEIYIMHA